jgi:hypothetical protein
MFTPDPRHRAENSAKIADQDACLHLRHKVQLPPDASANPFVYFERALFDAGL